MTIVIARLKQGGKWLLAVALLVGAAVWALFRVKRQAKLQPDNHVDLALQRYEQITANASARAAVEIAVARTTLKTERARLIAVLNDPDEERRNERLIAEAKQLRGDP